MGLFRCKHYVPMAKMKSMVFEQDRVGDYSLGYGAVIKYKGFCRECDAYVELREEIVSRALFEYFERNFHAPTKV